MMHDIVTPKTKLFIKGLYIFSCILVISSPVLAQEQDDWTLCPEPGEALQNVPSGPAEIQADIDRFTLCLDRAEILLKLDELSSRGDELAGNNMGDLGLPITPTPLTSAQTEELLLGDGSNMAPQVQLADYTVIAISGASGDLNARLNTPDGDIQTVRVNDSLEDGTSITSISSTQVAARKDGKTRILKWDN